MSTTGAGSDTSSSASENRILIRTNLMAKHLMEMLSLEDLYPIFKSFANTPITFFAHIQCKKCYTYARSFSENAKTGYYVEGYLVSPTLSIPTWHGWYMPNAETIYDSEINSHENFPFRKGLIVPVKTFKAYMKNKTFQELFGKYVEMPFHRTCLEMGLQMDWLDKQNTFAGGFVGRMKKVSRKRTARKIKASHKKRSRRNTSKKSSDKRRR